MTSDKPKYPKPSSAWRDGGDVWTNDKSRYGMRYSCKHCGKSGSGYGSAGNVESHWGDCPMTAEERARRDAKVAEQAVIAATASETLKALDWSAVSDEMAIRIAGMVRP